MSEKFNIPPLPPTEQDMDDLQKALIENQGKSLETESDILRAHRAGREEKIKTVENTEAQEKPVEKSENQKLVDSISRLIESGLIEQIKEHKSYPDLIHIPEMRTKAFASFNSFCNENKIPAAFDIMDVFELPAEKCTKGIAQVVTNVFEKGGRAREATWQEPERDRYRHGRYESEDHREYDSDYSENAPLPDDTLTSREMVAKLPKNILESKEVQDAAKQAFVKEIPHLLAGDRRESRVIQRVDDMISIFDLRKDFIVSTETLGTVSKVFGEMFSHDRYYINRFNLSSILPYERYFASPEFYDIPGVKAFATHAIYKEQTSKSGNKISVVKNLFDARQRFNISDEELKKESRANFEEGIKSLIQGYGTGKEQVSSAHKYLRLSEEEIENEVLKNIPEFQKKFKDASNMETKGDSLLELQQSLKKLGVDNLFSNPEIQNVIQNAVIETLEHYAQQERERGLPNNNTFQWCRQLASHYKDILKFSNGGPLLTYIESNIDETLDPSKDLLYKAENSINILQEFFPNRVDNHDKYARKLVVTMIKKDFSKDHYQPPQSKNIIERV